MNSFFRQAIDQGLALNQRLASTVSNGYDWLFRREELVKSGKTWFELVHDGDPMSVRYYGLPEETEISLPDGSRLPIVRPQFAVPLVLVPPLGVTGNTFDLMPDRSLARYMAARGFRTYMIDWGKPKAKHAKLGMREYADTMMGEALGKIRAHAGMQEVSMMGWCMGGLLIMIHAGLTHARHIRNIVTVASPVDMRGGGIVASAASLLDVPSRLIRQYSNFKLHSLDPALMSVPGWMTTLSFKLTDPVGSVTTYWDLLTRLWDREFVESHTTTSNYLNKMLRYPGGILQDMTVKVAVDNKLASGQIDIGDKLADFGTIKSSLLVFAGETDHLVAKGVAAKLIDVAGSSDKEFRVVAGGHMGVILGSKAFREVWGPSADWLGPRSSAKGVH
jgi:polyhydroxyalkanoate synthase